MVWPALDQPTYTAERAANLAAAREQRKFFDSSLISLSGGALGLSLTFIHALTSRPVVPYLLYVGGACLVACIVAVLLSLHASDAAINDYVDQLDKHARAGFTPDSVGDWAGNYVNSKAAITARLNLSASILLIVGIASVAGFAYMNIAFRPEKESAMTAEQQKTAVVEAPEKKGYVPPKPATTPPAPQPAQQGDKK